MALRISLKEENPILFFIDANMFRIRRTKINISFQKKHYTTRLII